MVASKNQEGIFRRDLKRKRHTKPVGSVEERMGAAPWHSEEEREQLLKLGGDVVDMQMNLAEFNAYTKDWMGQNEEKMARQASKMNQLIQRRLMLMCVMPLAQGITADSLIDSVGMAVGMALMSSDFKDELRKGAAFVYNTRANLAGEKGNALKQAKMQARADQFLTKANGGRVPLSYQSVATMSLALDKEAFETMRSGVDGNGRKVSVQTVLGEWSQAKDNLYMLGEMDGLDREQMDASTRTLAGEFIDRDPAWASIWRETAFNDVTKSKMHETSVDAVDEHGAPLMDVDGSHIKESRYVWDGQFDDNRSGVSDGSGSFTGTFTPRVPEATDELLVNKLSHLMMDDLVHTVKQDEISPYTVAHMNRIADIYQWALNDCIATVGRDEAHVDDKGDIDYSVAWADRVYDADASGESTLRDPNAPAGEKAQAKARYNQGNTHVPLPDWVLNDKTYLKSAFEARQFMTNMALDGQPLDTIAQSIGKAQRKAAGDFAYAYPEQAQSFVNTMQWEKNQEFKAKTRSARRSQYENGNVYDSTVVHSEDAPMASKDDSWLMKKLRLSKEGRRRAMRDHTNGLNTSEPHNTDIDKGDDFSL